MSVQTAVAKHDIKEIALADEGRRRTEWAERSMPDVPLAEPTRTTLRPKTRCSGDAVRSTVRMRSRGTERRSRRSQPVRSSTRSPVIR